MKLQQQLLFPLFFMLSTSFACFAQEPAEPTSPTKTDQKMFVDNKPITIDADNQQIDIDKNIITFIGHVQIVQEGLTIWADKVVITDMQDSTKQKITAYGNPVKFKQILPENNKIVTGHSDQIIYNVKQSNVVLQGKAELFQEDNHIVSQVITYDVKKQLIMAQPKNGRVKSTIIPSQIKEIKK
ncbi:MULTISPECIES: lipopolysaccharide transport periplasmic protein LptA [unclassified Gilliamella]|uniref:lipopolysaccharide transport periplasmic protein LptA n=1 Tax=unclassified Gilliamella TaxID=2685620 RepID=UPI00226AC0E2|nr:MULTISPECIES: lipopolysaccharide transport periplasmic protein LptA [unclassified Gilliamella]MCX8642165.1 lipopolysaccharide transport periplasmic protein LptA [Gilliamella sp. B3835]MCX8707351.1 lipopolysaccharide transport periplasmic protein LptA [Gilliamella sp. B3783]MCX8710740.1 lipopolysaccharide transport periplasmic protein LptA [Gilliamella sp. B3780]MCX8713908.1 lipopolysaccharide transport periplasmic protein LptA [Gilliamella sp. B3781]MCX8716333.1 lipopolysaccharide transport